MLNVNMEDINLKAITTIKNKGKTAYYSTKLRAFNKNFLYKIEVYAIIDMIVASMEF